VEIEEIRDWIDDYLEEQLELTDEVKARLDQSRRDEFAAAVLLGDVVGARASRPQGCR
jgi:hypothetical protein